MTIEWKNKKAQLIIPSYTVHVCVNNIGMMHMYGSYILTLYLRANLFVRLFRSDYLISLHILSCLKTGKSATYNHF